MIYLFFWWGGRCTIWQIRFKMLVIKGEISRLLIAEYFSSFLINVNRKCPQKQPNIHTYSSQDFIEKYYCSLIRGNQKQTWFLSFKVIKHFYITYSKRSHTKIIISSYLNLLIVNGILYSGINKRYLWVCGDIFKAWVAS